MLFNALESLSALRSTSNGTASVSSAHIAEVAPSGDCETIPESSHHCQSFREVSTDLKSRTARRAEKDIWTYGIEGN